MKKQLLAVPLLIMSVSLNALAGEGSPSTCSYSEEVLMSTPMQVYLPDGMTEKTVGEASLISRKRKCTGGENEIIDVRIKLDDEIKPYGIKIKDKITGFETFANVDFRLKELVNTTDDFYITPHAKTQINNFGSVGILDITMDNSHTLFWINTVSKIDGLITASSNGSSNDRPLACSLNKAFVTLTKKATGKDGLKQDLRLTAIFQGPLQFCQ